MTTSLPGCGSIPHWLGVETWLCSWGCDDISPDSGPVLVGGCRHGRRRHVGRSSVTGFLWWHRGRSVFLQRGTPGQVPAPTGAHQRPDSERATLAAAILS